MTPAVAEHGAAPASPAGTLSFRRLLWQFGTLLLGFLLVVAFHVSFQLLLGRLEGRSAGERSRMFIGEEISCQIKGIESDVYHLATVAGERGHAHVTRRIGERMAIVRHAVAVLREGGVLERRISASRYGDEQVIQALRYRPGDAETQYPVEVVDLLPKLAEIESRIGELTVLLAARDAQGEAGDRNERVRREGEVKSFLKHLPAHFVRLGETANQLRLDSHRKLAELESRTQEQQRRYVVGEVAGVFVIMAALVVLGVRFARHSARSNEQLRRAWETMRAARDDAEQASRAKSVFVSRMSHELRTPMNAILGFAQLLELSPSLRAEQRTQVREINRAGTHLLALINDVLDLAKIEAGQLVFEHIPFDLVDTADEVVAILGEWAQSRGLDVDAFISPALPAQVLGDPTRVRQVLMNLLSNAVKFTERGRVGLRVEQAVEQDEGRHGVRFEVWDTGIGFDAETGRRLFRPFTQADGSTSRRFGGSGLGLIICKELVQGMGGELHFESAPGKGTRFWYTLPLQALPSAGGRPCPAAGMTLVLVTRRPSLIASTARYAAALEASFVHAQDEAQASGAIGHAPGPAVVLLDAPFRGLAATLAASARVLLVVRAGLPDQGETLADPAVSVIYEPLTYSRLRDALVPAPAAGVPGQAWTAPGGGASGHALAGHVLLVEDNPVNQLVALEMLASLGLTADAASNGVEALAGVATRRYDLVLMDVEMPELDGYETTRRIRAAESDSNRPRLAVVAMTANALNEDRERCLASGMDDHLGKPVTLEQLATILRRWLPPSAQAGGPPDLRQAG